MSISIKNVDFLMIRAANSAVIASFAQCAHHSWFPRAQPFMIINNYCLTNRNSTDFGWLSLVKLIVWKRSEKIEKLTVHVRLFFLLIRKIRWIDIFFRPVAESAKWKSWLLTLSKRMTNDILVRRSRCVFSTIFAHRIERDWTTGIRCVWIPSIRHDSEVMKIYSARLLVT